MNSVTGRRFALLLTVWATTWPTAVAAQTTPVLPSPLSLGDVIRLASERRDEIQAARARTSSPKPPMGHRLRVSLPRQADSMIRRSTRGPSLVGRRRLARLTHDSVSCTTMRSRARADRDFVRTTTFRAERDPILMFTRMLWHAAWSAFSASTLLPAGIDKSSDFAATSSRSE
jgi:hypothetical protein